MSTYQMTPGDKLLPLPSIMEKWVKSDPESAAAIFSLMEEIAEEGKRIDQMLLKVGKPFHQTFWEGLTSLFNPESSMNKSVRLYVEGILTDEEAENFGWVRTGNNLRRAIRQYMEEHPKIAAKIELSEAEIESLMPIPLWVSPAQTEKINRLPKEARVKVVERLDLAFNA
jgi:hypothetical protein